MRGLSTMPTRSPGAFPTRYRRRREAPGTIGRDRLRTRGNPASLAWVVRRRGFFGRVARAARYARPPLSADQQLRLLQLALNVKLKREGKPPDSIRLSLVEREAPGGDRVPVGDCARPPTASRSTVRAW